jgi:F-type H+-transporting ATPase subunit b
LNIKPPLLLVNIVGFVLLWMLLKKFLWKPAGEFLAQRQQTIQNTIDEAERQRAEMQRMREEYEQRLEEIEQEHRDRIQAAQREAHAARDELLAEARAERDRVVAAGVREIQREKEKALVEIRDQVADLAVLAAAQVIGRELDERTHRSLISGVIEGVGRN